MAKGTKKKVETLLPTYYTITEYAEKKGVEYSTVSNHIKDKKIIPETIGATGKLKMIDWEKYKDHKFAAPKFKFKS